MQSREGQSHDDADGTVANARIHTKTGTAKNIPA
jgi:hypothetical protein